MTPPSFGDREYWDQRYAGASDEFEWLLPASSLDTAVLAALESSSSPAPRIIHLGCGTSSLSFQLRKIVPTPGQVHNVDFSGPCIEAGREKERALFGTGEGEGGGDGGEGGGMEWSVLDLLSSEQITRLAGEDGSPRPYEVVVDKSTLDSICCGDDVAVPPPSLIRAAAGDVPPDVSSTVPARSTMYPMDLLAVHLAHLTPPGAHWIALSYSGMRFDGWWPADGSDPATRWIRSETNCLPHPSRLWQLKSMEGIPVKEDHAGENAVAVHRPEILHYLFTLVRTDVSLASGAGD
ncbi:uncharacterized protein DNG_04680 [Cephalotrichum gorgonifer]|uniref:Methyltransferase domain-containing protein n=1 Tax=Cephalotrichum gorgonifer TaxID=2041049 RepID=A0AAE8MZG3_9PEZI|nr:uncharacterized protein DNG_04680 [Cephalotrichum gorgonifer]